MSTLRARCPDCRTLTAVAVGAEYQCHSCGRAFAAGLVRVPRAWGVGGEVMASAAWLVLPYPEAAVVAEESLEAQNDALVRNLPVRPLVLGGCCCAHIGTIRGLAARRGVLAVIWIDAHGDLNTPETSPSGDVWGMPLRMVIDEGSVRAENVALVGARNLDPPEREYLVSAGIDDDIDSALDGCDRVYVALDCDVIAPGELSVFIPEPGGPTVADVEALLHRLAVGGTLAGLGLTGLREGADTAIIQRLATAAGL